MRFSTLMASIFALVLALIGVTNSCTTNPTMFTVTQGMNNITISWDAVTGTAPITYEVSSSIDGTTLHSGLTLTEHNWAGLSDGVLYEATTRVQANCDGTMSQPFTQVVTAATIPSTPVLTINSDDNEDIILFFEHEGEADTYVVMNSFFSGGEVSSSTPYIFVEGLSAGSTYLFEGYTMLNGAQSATAEISHSVDDDKIMGLPPMVFSLVWILVIIFIVLLIILIVVMCYCYRKKKNERSPSRESAQNLEDGQEDNEGAGREEKEPWAYKDPYENAQYRLTETQKKRAYATRAALAQAAMNNN